MKIAGVLLALLAATSSGTVRKNTSHAVDAALFDRFLRASGVDTEVSVEWYGDGWQYIAWFDGDTCDIGDDCEEAIAVALAAGFASASAGCAPVWSVAVYEEIVIRMLVDDCRELVRLCASRASDERIGDFYLDNSDCFDREALGYPVP